MKDLTPETPPTKEQRLRAWWWRWMQAHAAEPNVRAHERQLRHGLVFPVERLGEHRALKVRTTGEARR